MQLLVKSNYYRLLRVSKTKTKLKSVSCRGTLLSNHGAQMLGDMKKIQSLNISECQLIQDWEKVMRKINPDIDRVDFSIIKSLNNNGVKELAFNCRQIRLGVLHLSIDLDRVLETGSDRHKRK